MEMQKPIHLTGKDLTDMVQLRPQDVGKWAIVPGPKDRMDVLTKKLKDAVRNFSFMEYAMYTGEYEGMKITTINGGRFSADTAITTEVVCNAKIKNIIRIGTCGALDEKMQIGDLLVVDSVIRGDGVTPYYVDENFITTPDKKLTDTRNSQRNGIAGIHRQSLDHRCSPPGNPRSSRSKAERRSDRRGYGLIVSPYHQPAL